MDRVTICNMALEFFGANPITSIEEADIDSDEARLCFTFFDPSVRAAMEESAPSFAVDLIDLGARQDSAYGLLTAGLVQPALVAKFTLPGTVVRPLRCDDGSGEFAIKWEPRLRSIVCEDTNTLLCEAVFYTPELSDPNTWSAKFQFAAAYKLASVICGPITHSSSIKREMLEEYAKASKEAGNLNDLAGTTNEQFKTGRSSLANRR